MSGRSLRAASYIRAANAMKTNTGRFRFLDAGLLRSLLYDGMPRVPKVAITRTIQYPPHRACMPFPAQVPVDMILLFWAGWRRSTFRFMRYLESVALSCVAFLGGLLQVLRTAPKAAKATSRSMADASTTVVAAASPDEPNAGRRSSSSADLDGVFARLEAQEEKAEKDGGFSYGVLHCRAVPVFVCNEIEYEIRYFFGPNVLFRATNNRVVCCPFMSSCQAVFFHFLGWPFCCRIFDSTRRVLWRVYDVRSTTVTRTSGDEESIHATRHGFPLFTQSGTAYRGTYSQKPTLPTFLLSLGHYQRGGLCMFVCSPHAVVCMHVCTVDR